MKTTAEKIEVMQAYERGEEMEVCRPNEDWALWSEEVL